MVNALYYLSKLQNNATSHSIPAPEAWRGVVDPDCCLRLTDNCRGPFLRPGVQLYPTPDNQRHMVKHEQGLGGGKTEVQLRAGGQYGDTGVQHDQESDETGGGWSLSHSSCDLRVTQSGLGGSGGDAGLSLGGSGCLARTRGTND